jgi:peptidyl-prolyl cis-trans isomerase D
MIQFIRDHAKGVIAWIIIILVLIPFALWGVNEYFRGGSTDLTVAKVGRHAISAQEFQQVYQREVALRRQMMGDAFAAQNEAAIKHIVLDGMIGSEVTVQAALKAGFRVSDARVGREIRAISQFQRDGKFDPELYGQLLRGVGLSQSQFEENMRRDMLAAQFTGGVADSAFVTAHELERWLRLSEQQRKVGYFLVKAENYLDKSAPTDAEIAQYYQDNLEHFAVPEQVRAQYVELSPATVKQSVSVDEAALRHMYEDQAATFTVGEERRARHILIKVAENADAATVAAAKAKVDQLRARLVAGESFADLARQNSADTGSAQQGGELGFFGRGVMVGPFEDTVFSLKKGEISAPVRTAFGWHIIELEDIKPGSTRSFNDVRASLEEDYKKSKVEERMYDLSDTLTNLTYEHPDTLKFAADGLGLAIQTTGLFSRDHGDGVAANDNFRAAAFGEDVIDGGNNSETIQFEDGRVVVLRIVEKQPATHRPLDEVRAGIRDELRRQSAQRLAEETGKTIHDRLLHGDAVDAIARETKAVWQAPALIKREEAGVPAEVLDTAFTLGRPAPDHLAAGGVALGSGDYAVVALYGVFDGDPATVSPTERSTQRSEIQRHYTQQDREDMQAALRARAKIAVFQDRL